jgi:hypothetical protein
MPFLNHNLSLNLNSPGDAGIKSKITIKIKISRGAPCSVLGIAHLQPQLP